MATKPRFSVEDLCTLPDGGRRYEIIDGEPREKPMPSLEHAAVSANAAYEFRRFLVDLPELGRALIEPHFRLGLEPERTRVADVAVLARERWDRADQRAAAYDGAPDLAVEIVSPSDVYGAVRAKALEWLEAGARLVWVVQPLSRTVEVHRSGEEVRVLRAGETLDGGEVLPGFSMPVERLFG